MKERKSGAEARAVRAKTGGLEVRGQGGDGL